MNPTPLIIDCDPGVDDAIALLLAFACPEALEIIAITTVAGNVNADLTARNARIIRRIAEREDVPVFRGAAGPLVRDPIEAGEFHGASGLGWLEIVEPAAPLAEGHAVLAMIEAVMTRPAGAVSIAVLGPMTNLALAMRLEPAIIARLGTVVVMGGARGIGGNVTASAEYNIFADPHAAQIVFGSGCKVVTLGLDATHQVRITPARLETAGTIDTEAGRAVRSLLAFACHAEGEYGVGVDSPLHDPCTIAWLLAPELFETAPVDLRVETASALTLGHTAVEFRLADPAKASVHWAIRADADRVFNLLFDRLAR